jgi:hypothetical protein
LEQHFNRNGNQFFLLCYSNEIARLSISRSQKKIMYLKSFQHATKLFFACTICHDMQNDHDIHEHEEMKSFFLQLLNISMDSCFVLWMLIRIKNQWFFPMYIRNMSWLLWCFYVGEEKKMFNMWKFSESFAEQIFSFLCWIFYIYSHNEIEMPYSRKYSTFFISVMPLLPFLSLEFHGNSLLTVCFNHNKSKRYTVWIYICKCHDKNVKVQEKTIPKNLHWHISKGWVASMIGSLFDDEWNWPNYRGCKCLTFLWHSQKWVKWDSLTICHAD